LPSARRGGALPRLLRIGWHDVVHERRRTLELVRRAIG